MDSINITLISVKTEANGVQVALVYKANSKLRKMRVFTDDIAGLLISNSIDELELHELKKEILDSNENSYCIIRFLKLFHNI
jgi:hypothetical protein